MVADILQNNFTIAGELRSGASVIDQFQHLQPDVIILDVSLGDMTGFEVARRLKMAGCTAKIMFLTVHENIDFVRAAFNLGASAYIFKSQIDSDLLQALEVVLQGGCFSSFENQRWRTAKRGLTEDSKLH